MKKHFNAIITKFLFFAPVFGFIGPIFSNMDLKEAILTAGIITLATYLSADLVLLPQYGTKIAMVGDAVISIAVFWEMSNVITGAKVNFPGIFLATVLIVFGEWYFHRYFINTVLYKKQQSNAKNSLAVTEIKSKSNHGQTNKKNKKNQKKKKSR